MPVDNPERYNVEHIHESNNFVYNLVDQEAKRYEGDYSRVYVGGSS